MINDPFDLETVRAWLERWRKANCPFLAPALGTGWNLRPSAEPLWVIPGAIPAMSFDRQTENDILAFQRYVLRMAFPTGVIRPGDATERQLAAGPQVQKGPVTGHGRPPIGPLPQSAVPGTPMQLPARTGFQELSAEDYKGAGAKIGCEPEVIETFARVEGKGHGFDRFNRPVILFEPTHFATLALNGRDLSVTYPKLTHKMPAPHPYGSDTLQWQHLMDAYVLAPRAALQATSWGKFQQLGQYCHDAGYATAEAMVAAYCQSEQVQLDGFVARITNTGLTQALVSKNWDQCASGYNGRNYKKQKNAAGKTYDQVLQETYDKIKAQ